MEAIGDFHVKNVEGFARYR